MQFCLRIRYFACPCIRFVPVSGLSPYPVCLRIRFSVSGFSTERRKAPLSQLDPPFEQLLDDRIGSVKRDANQGITNSIAMHSRKGPLIVW